jgi:methionyl-tRNA formyltransferase
MSNVSSAIQCSWTFVGQNSLGGAALAALAQKIGTPQLIVTREKKFEHANDVESVAVDLGVRIVRAIDHRLDRFVTDFAIAGVLICCGWARRIPTAVFTAPMDGTLNLHPGPLPLWAGSDPIGWQLAVNAIPIGFTVHRMSSVIDGGEVLGRGSYMPMGSETGLDLRRSIGHRLGLLAGDIVRGDRARGSMPRESMAVTPPRGVIASITPSSMPVEVVDRVVRAFSPFPGVFARIGEEMAEVRAASSGAPARNLICLDGTVKVEVVRLFREVR